MRRDYPPAAPRPWAIALIVVVLALLVVTAIKAAPPTGSEPDQHRITYQGKDAHWWAMRAQQARRDANARRLTIRRLQRTLRYSPTIQEAVTLATIAYPAFTESRAWAIIRHESQGNPNAKNRSSTASGLYQFLTSTWASTPYGRTSIWNPYAASLAAGWMHQQGRRCEWWC